MGYQPMDFISKTWAGSPCYTNQANYFWRKTIRPFVKSYGDNCTFTRSPGRIRMKCLRIFPETMPRISWAPAPSSLSLNMAFGKAVVTVASTSIGSDLATGFFSALFCSRINGQLTKRYSIPDSPIEQAATWKHCALLTLPYTSASRNLIRTIGREA